MVGVKTGLRVLPGRPRKEPTIMKDIGVLLEVQGYVVYGVDVSEREVEVRVGRPKKEARCPHCGRLTRRVHSAGRLCRKLHGWLGPRKVYLVLRRRRFLCQGCGKTFSEPVPGIGPWARMTDRAKLQLLEELAGSSFSAVARRRGTSYPTIRRILEWRVPLVPALWRMLPPGEGISLGIDEHSFRGNNLVVTVACLRPVRMLLAVLLDDRLSTLRAYLRNLPPEFKERVQEVCIDMKEGYRKLIGEELPWARVVLDKFHVIQDANRRVDEARKIEQQVRREAARRRQEVNIPKWPLLKNRENLSPKQEEVLEQALQAYPNVAAFYRLKEDLRAVYRCSDAEEAARELSRAIMNAQNSDDAELRRWSRTLQHWRKEILAYFPRKTTNGFVEGLHCKIKFLKRAGYGFRNVSVYVRRMLLACVPDISTLLAPHVLT